MGEETPQAFSFDMTVKDEEVWLRAWLAVASCFNGKAPDCTRYADTCLADFKQRFRTSTADGERGDG